jgi:radical SAM protein with 4Fe4S-binding SPASM domain
MTDHEYPVITKGYGVFITPKGGYIFPYKNENGVDRPLPPCKTLNVQACAILNQCTGNNTVKDIVHILEQTFEEVPPHFFEQVHTFLDKTAQQQYISNSKKPVPLQGLIQGSLDYYVPSQVLFEVTTTCNLQCGHCLVSAGEPLPDELSIPQILFVINQLYAMGVKRLMISGGEVVTKKGWESLIQYCANRFFFALLTNGTLITDKIADTLASCREIHISLYGKDAATHEIVTGVKGSFEKAVNSITLLKERGIYVGVSALMFSFNLEQLEDMVKLAASLHSDIVRIGSVCPVGRARHKHWELTGSQQKWLDTKIDELQQKYDICIQREEEPGERCGAGYTRWVISANGDVYPCGVLRIPLGNVIKENPVAVCQSEPVTFLQNVKAPHYNLCGTCEHLSVCEGCHQQAFFNALTVDHCYWVQQFKYAPPLLQALWETYKKKKKNKTTSR